jgi:hypothetical protein
MRVRSSFETPQVLIPGRLSQEEGADRIVGSGEVPSVNVEQARVGLVVGKSKDDA